MVKKANGIKILLGALLGVFILAGCSGKTGAEKKKAEETADNIFTAFLEQDADALDKFLPDTGLGSFVYNDPEGFQMYTSRMSWKITGCEEKNDLMYVRMEVTNVDMVSILEEHPPVEGARMPDPAQEQIDGAKTKTFDYTLPLIKTKGGYECIAAERFDQAAEEILKAAPDLVLLDLSLPFQDGFYICRRLRETSDVPVIVVTSSSSDMDELMSLNLGADDFITKPYNTHILLAHIAAVLQRTNGRKAGLTLVHNGLTLDMGKSKASYRDKSVELTKNELGIMRFLMQHKGIIVLWQWKGLKQFTLNRENME